MKIEDSTIGFIGLGEMGQRIARRLVDHGFRLAVFDRTAARMDGLKAAGATPLASLRTLAANSRVIISCLSNDTAVLEVYSGTRGVLAAAQAGTVVIEMSTVSPETSQTLSDLACKRDVEILDVTISGSTPAAEEGTLVLFGGGEQQVFERCRPIFSAIARAHFYMGNHGAGCAMKPRREHASDRRGGGPRRADGTRPLADAPGARAHCRRSACSSGQVASCGTRGLFAAISARTDGQGLQAYT
jgi:3-hydroxyisobutyrate dehydrogenase-like beta-hydroxyacid dehydrogenase